MENTRCIIDEPMVCTFTAAVVWCSMYIYEFSVMFCCAMCDLYLRVKDRHCSVNDVTAFDFFVFFSLLLQF